jgi:cell division protein FtsL
MAVAVARSRTAPKGRAKPKRRGRSQRRTAGPAVWIVLMGILLAGVVALNVAVLRLNLEFDSLARERDQVRAESAELASQLAARSASARTSSLARHRLGYVPAEMTTYLDLGRR